MAKLPACLNGYKHKIAGFVFIALGLFGMLDPSAANIIVEGLKMAGMTITVSQVLSFSGVVIWGLKWLDKACKA
jgi:hypothetical protein